MFQKILVPLDGSQRAERILPFVEEMALQFKSEVFFLQVIHPEFLQASKHGFSARVYEDLLEELRMDARNYLLTHQGVYKEKGIKSNIVVQEGSPVNTIIAIAERNDIDLIAMASHGRTGLARVFYGSVASGVLNRVSHPILMIRALEQ